MAEEGYLKGEKCNRNDCIGIIDEHEKEGCCSCHINPPCSYCTELNAFCETCGWSALEEQYEIDRINSELYKKNQVYYENQRVQWQEAEELFSKKFRGEIQADKLEIRAYSHSNSSMRKIGVFPKGSETKETLLPHVIGTFGGRFTMLITKDSFRFEYIAYTD